jgi:hypothetical protein
MKQTKEKEFEDTEMNEVKNTWENNLYETLDNSVIINLPTLEFLIKQHNTDYLALFNFYCYCSKIQRNTRRIWATKNYIMKNLHWGGDRIKKTKKKLLEFGIIKDIELRKKDGSFDKWLIEIMPLMNAPNVFKSSEHPVGLDNKTPSGPKPPSMGIQALSSIEINNSSIESPLDLDKSKSRERDTLKKPSEVMHDFLESYQKSKERTYKRLEATLNQELDEEQCDEVDKFVDYWTERNKSGTKQRWEIEKTFELSRRLKTWFNRSLVFQGIKEDRKEVLRYQ